jgi:hypothetical protein
MFAYLKKQKITLITSVIVSLLLSSSTALYIFRFFFRSLKMQIALLGCLTLLFCVIVFLIISFLQKVNHQKQIFKTIRDVLPILIGSFLFALFSVSLLLSPPPLPPASQVLEITGADASGGEITVLQITQGETDQIVDFSELEKQGDWQIGKQYGYNTHLLSTGDGGNAALRYEFMSKAYKHIRLLFYASPEGGTIRVNFNGQSQIVELNQSTQNEVLIELETENNPALLFAVRIIDLFSVFFLSTIILLVYRLFVKDKYQPTKIEVATLIFGILFVFWYAWIMDDAYVYFRYVDNLVIHRVGLVYNAGEFVEGFSSPFWVLLLIPLRVLKMNYWTTTRLIGILSYGVFWVLAVIINRKMLDNWKEKKNKFILNLPLIYLTFSYSVIAYFTSGLESPLVLISAVVYAAVILSPSSSILQLVIGLTPLLRHELIIPYGIILLWLFYKNRKMPYAAILSCILSLGGYLLFRVWYYADLFPNTFYLKDEVWILQGLKYLYDTFLPNDTVAYLIFMLSAILFVRKKGEQLLLMERLMMILAALPIVLYVIKIGGDPRHFRYLAFPYTLIVISTAGLAEKFLLPLLKEYKHATLLFFLVFSFSVSMNYPRQLTQHPVFRESFDFQHHQFLLINDSSVHRFFYSPDWNEFGEWLSYESAVERYKNAQSSIQATSLCEDSYRDPGASIVQSLGLTEPFLARTVMVSNRPAHKWGLKDLAADIVTIRETYGFGPGVFDKAIIEGTANPWIIRNIDSIRLIEKKVYNPHHFFENLKLIFTRIDKIQP